MRELKSSGRPNRLKLSQICFSFFQSEIIAIEHSTRKIKWLGTCSRKIFSDSQGVLNALASSDVKAKSVWYWMPRQKSLTQLTPARVFGHSGQDAMRKWTCSQNRSQHDSSPNTEVISTLRVLVFLGGVCLAQMQGP